MGYDAEGTITIPAEEFWEFVLKYLPNPLGGEIIFSPPIMTSDKIDLVINYALSTHCNPKDWSKKNKIVQEWEEYKETKILKSPY